jgi:hypothetical protein
MIREITTYDGHSVRSRDPYDTRPYTEVKVGKLYECTECGSYFTKFEDHTQYCPSIKTKLESRSMT